MGLMVELPEQDKNYLEKLQLRLKQISNIQIDHIDLLRALILFGGEKFGDFLNFLQGTSLTDEEIEEIHKKYVKSYSYHHPELSDDELIYGDRT